MAYVLDEVPGMDYDEQPLVAQVSTEVDNELGMEGEALTPPDGTNGRDVSYLILCSELEPKQKEDTRVLHHEFRDVFSELPGCTNTLYHDISLCSTDILKSKYYPIPVHLQAHFEKEVDILMVPIEWL